MSSFSTYIHIHISKYIKIILSTMMQYPSPKEPMFGLGTSPMPDGQFGPTPTPDGRVGQRLYYISPMNHYISTSYNKKTSDAKKTGRPNCILRERPYTFWPVGTSSHTNTLKLRTIDRVGRPHQILYMVDDPNLRGALNPPQIKPPPKDIRADGKLQLPDSGHHFWGHSTLFSRQRSLHIGYSIGETCWTLSTCIVPITYLCRKCRAFSHTFVSGPSGPKLKESRTLVTADRMIRGASALLQ